MEPEPNDDIVNIIANTKIIIKFEKKLWLKYILDKLVEKPNKCKLCNYT